MYYIITNDVSIVNFAKKRGAEILNTEKSVVIEKESETEVKENKKGISGKVIDAFFGGFYYVNKKTLGYKCVKYILQNNIDCTGDFENIVYPILTQKFDAKTRVIKQSLTYFLNNCRFNGSFGMPKDFKKFYEKHNENKRETIEDSNFAFIRICRSYLENKQ